MQPKLRAKESIFMGGVKRYQRRRREAGLHPNPEASQQLQSLQGLQAQGRSSHWRKQPAAGAAGAAMGFGAPCSSGPLSSSGPWSLSVPRVRSKDPLRNPAHETGRAPVFKILKIHLEPRPWRLPASSRTFRLAQGLRAGLPAPVCGNL